jgi:hypothetical protein
MGAKIFPKKNKNISIVIQSGIEVISYMNSIYPTIIFHFPFSIFN